LRGQDAPLRVSPFTWLEWRAVVHKRRLESIYRVP
jgi:hypothetical protein